jgi:hypothetical protein
MKIICTVGLFMTLLLIAFLLGFAVGIRITWSSPPAQALAGISVSSEIACLARSTDSSVGGPAGFSVASAWLSATNGRIRCS